jgi:hypothetical protein
MDFRKKDLHFVVLNNGVFYIYIYHLLKWYFVNMSTAKVNRDRGTINKINRQQHPPPRKVRVYSIRDRINMGAWDVPRIPCWEILSHHSQFLEVNKARKD